MVPPRKCIGTDFNFIINNALMHYLIDLSFISNHIFRDLRVSSFFLKSFMLAINFNGDHKTIKLSSIHFPSHHIKSRQL